MKKLTGIVAISFMAGMLCFGLGERVADEVWASKTAHAAASTFSTENCNDLEVMYKRLWGIVLKYDVRKILQILRVEHCQ